MGRDGVDGARLEGTARYPGAIVGTDMRRAVTGGRRQRGGEGLRCASQRRLVAGTAEALCGTGRSLRRRTSCLTARSALRHTWYA